jgi:hypothetical protein
MLKRRVGFLLCLWKSDPALKSEEALGTPARAQRAALRVRNAAPEPFDETLQKLPSILIGDCTVHIADSQCMAQMRLRHVDT